jgi:hypothetical protein
MLAVRLQKCDWTRPSKTGSIIRLETPTQSVRAFNPTFHVGPFWVSHSLVPRHVGRKECHAYPCRTAALVTL